MSLSIVKIIIYFTEIIVQIRLAEFRIWMESSKTLDVVIVTFTLLMQENIKNRLFFKTQKIIKFHLIKINN